MAHERVRRGGVAGKSVQWTDLSDERRELGRAAGGNPAFLGGLDARFREHDKN
jgi:hypothetical protein